MEGENVSVEAHIGDGEREYQAITAITIYTRKWCILTIKKDAF